MQSLIGQKKVQSQRFLENGARIPVTLIDVKDNVVMAIKSEDKDSYQAVQLGYGAKKKANKAELGHAKKGANLENAPKFLKEVRIKNVEEVLPEVGAVLNPAEVFEPGDMINVTGISKGKGFAGGVKRWGFRGGPKTHGQSDRHRAPGSIGQGTTPGRVYKGKKMAGRMGSDQVTVANLEIIDITNDGVLVVKGLVPGVIDNLIYIEKVGKNKNYVPLQKTLEQIAAEEEIRLAEEKAQKESEEKAAIESAKASEEAVVAEAESSSAEASEGQESNEVVEVAPVEEVPAEVVETTVKESSEDAEQGEVKDGDK